MLAILLNKYPDIMAIIKMQLEEYVREAERKYNAEPGSYWYRFIRPDDPGIAGTAQRYWTSWTNATALHILGQAALTVPVANAYACFGWYLDFDPGDGGYLQILKQNVVKWEIPARQVYLQDNPKHLYIDFDSVVVGYQQELMDFITRNEIGAAQIGMSIPFMFRIASKAALNLD